MGALQPWHLIIILVIVLIVFGPGKIANLGKSLGEGIRELKKATSEEDAKGSADSVMPAAIAAQPIAPISAVQNCPSCKAVVPPSQKFCGVCGTSVVSSAAQITAHA